MRTIVILLSLITFIFSNQKNDEIVNKTINNYQRLKQAQCLFDRIQTINDNEIVSNGIYYTIIPDTILIQIIQPKNMSYLKTKDSLIIYIKDENYCEMSSLDNVDQKEKDLIKNLSFFNINFFYDLRSDYQIEFSHVYENDFIYKITPHVETPLLSYMYVRVDTAKFVYKAFEVFDKNERLISQTKFENFSYHKNGDLYFPTYIIQKMISNQMIFSEEFKLSRMKINSINSNTLFHIEIPENVEIIYR